MVIKQGDRRPAATAIAKDAKGVVIDLTGFTTPKFKMTDWNGVVKIDAAATIVDFVAGSLQYDWATGDTDVAGTYRAKFEAVDAAGKKLSIPNADYIFVQVVREK
jgi:hypothetical protein